MNYLATLEGAMAIALADGEFEEEKGEPYSSLIRQLLRTVERFAMVRVDAMV